MKEEIEMLKDAVKDHNGLYISQLSELDEKCFKEAGVDRIVALLPLDKNERLRYLGNILVQLIFNNKDFKEKRLGFYLGQQAQALSYLLNSFSFRNGEIEEFDKFEISNKLKHLIKN